MTIHISNKHKHLPEEIAIKLDNFVDAMNNLALLHSENIKQGYYDDADQCQYDIELIKAEYKNLRGKYDPKYNIANELLETVLEPLYNEGLRCKHIVRILKKLGYKQKEICLEASINPCLLSQHMKDRQELSQTNKNKLPDFA